MRKAFNLFVTTLLIVTLCGIVYAGEKAPQKVVDLAYSELVEIGNEPVIINAVQAENAKGKTLDRIKKMDEDWKNTAGFADYMKALMESECGQYIRTIQKSSNIYAEIFVMDNKGANVAMTDKTSDYWQGDEDKFVKSFNNGQGAVFVDDVEFDESSQAYLVQVSVPVMDNGNAIGAITFGIDIDAVK